MTVIKDLFDAYEKLAYDSIAASRMDDDETEQLEKARAASRQEIERHVEALEAERETYRRAWIRSDELAAQAARLISESAPKLSPDQADIGDAQRAAGIIPVKWTGDINTTWPSGKPQGAPNNRESE